MAAPDCSKFVSNDAVEERPAGIACRDCELEATINVPLLAVMRRAASSASSAALDKFARPVDHSRVPLHYTFSHPHRLVIALAKGPILAEEVIAFIARTDAENAQGYRKIFDVTDLETVFADDRIQRLADIVRGRASAGPIAIVARHEHARRQARLFAAAAGPARVIAVFHDYHVARKWLDELPMTPAAPAVEALPR
jgi:hypothetical protein